MRNLILYLPLPSSGGSCWWYPFTLSFKNFIYLLIFLCWVFVAMLELSLVAASSSYPLLQCTGSSSAGFSCCGAQVLGVQASLVVAHRLSCSMVCAIYPNQGSNLCPPALAGRFLSTVPPEQSLYLLLTRGHEKTKRDASGSPACQTSSFLPLQ